MKAKKLPSGNYRCRLYVGTDESGKKTYKSFTAPTAKEAVRLAYQFDIMKKVKEKHLSLGDAMQRYNKSKESVLSPSTLRSYRQYSENKLSDIAFIPLSAITSEMMQEWISEWSRTLSPKTVRNIYGYINIVMKFFGYGADINVTLPQKVPYEYHIISHDELKALIDRTKGSELGLAIVLASSIPARRSEVCALTEADIDRKNCTIRINKAVVKDFDGNFVTKTTKTKGSNRVVQVPRSVIDLIPIREGKIFDANPQQIEGRFLRAINSLGFKFRFHDLRHYCASFLHSEGVPDKTIMQRGGWTSVSTLQQIYQHSLAEKEQQANEIMERKFDSLFLD